MCYIVYTYACTNTIVKYCFSKSTRKQEQSHPAQHITTSEETTKRSRTLGGKEKLIMNRRLFIWYFWSKVHNVKLISVSERSKIITPYSCPCGVHVQEGNDLRERDRLTTIKINSIICFFWCKIQSFVSHCVYKLQTVLTLNCFSNIMLQQRTPPVFLTNVVVCLCFYGL